MNNVKSKGTATQPIYFNANGVAVACTYTLSKSVPSDAIFKYTAGAGISISGSTITNTGVRSIATGTSNGTVSVNINGTTSNIAVKGLGTAAYKNVSDFAAAGTYAAAESSSSSAAASAVKLKTARQLKVALGSTGTVTFDGSANVTNIPVSGTLAVANGGTGRTSFPASSVIYTNASSVITGMAATAENQVVMSNASKLPTWKNSSEILNGVDWGSLGSWSNTYVWDIMTGISQYQTHEEENNVYWSTDDLVDNNQYNAWTTLTINSNGSITLSGGHTAARLYSNTIIAKNKYYIFSTFANNSITDLGDSYTTTTDSIWYNTADNNQFQNISWEYWRFSQPFAIQYRFTGNYYRGNWETVLRNQGMNQTTHGRSGSTISICRGSLADILLQRRTGTYTGNGNRDFSINFQTLGWVPRTLVIGSRSSGHAVVHFFDTYNLSQANLQPTHYIGPDYGTYNKYTYGCAWTNNQYKSLNFSYSYGESNLNNNGCQYYFYALS